MRETYLLGSCKTNVHRINHSKLYLPTKRILKKKKIKLYNNIKQLLFFAYVIAHLLFSNNQVFQTLFFIMKPEIHYTKNLPVVVTVPHKKILTSFKLFCSSITSRRVPKNLIFYNKLYLYKLCYHEVLSQK